MLQSPPATYRFGAFELDLAARELRQKGEKVTLQDLPFRLLTVLVERAPALVSRDDLRAALWPPGTHLDVNASLNTAVARVRDALGDDPEQPRFVATVPRYGYRMVCPVERGNSARGLHKGSLVVALALCSAVVVALVIGLRRPDFAPFDTGREASTRRPTSTIAHEHILIARHQADRRSREGLEKAIASYQSAIAVEPENAEAYSGLAVSYCLLGIYDFWRPREAFGPAETMAQRALVLDPESGEAHLAMGLVAAGNWNWQTAAREAERAVELAPESPYAWYFRGGVLIAQGDYDGAVASTETARTLDPTSPMLNVALAWRLFQSRRYDEAIAQSHRAIELAPSYYDAWDNLKWIHLTLGHEAEAIEAWIRAEELDPQGGEDIRQMYRAHGVEGLHRESLNSQLGRFDRGTYQSPYDIALEYTALGEMEPAIAWLERSLSEGETDLIELAVDPRMDTLRGEPKFQAILREVGIPGLAPEGL